MAQEPRDIMLSYLRRLDGKFDVMAEDIASIKLRMMSLERHSAAMHSSDVDQTSEIDRLKARVDRVERRLELTE